MFERVCHYIGEMRLLEPGDRVVVAVSGGADSVALLDILTRLTDLSLHLVVAHLNHSLRGVESDEDEAFVHQVATRYGLQAVTKTVAVAELARRDRLSLEEAGRVARYAFLDGVAAACGARCIALAHHADDQAETVLMRLMRGCGTTGLTAIAPKACGGRYVRPLLDVSRAEIEAYLGHRSLLYRVDGSNADTRILRNRIRHELIPLLRSYNPAVSERLTVTAQLLREDEALLERVTSESFARLGTVDDGRTVLAVAGVRQELRGLRLRLYRHALRLTSGSLRRIASRHLFAIDGLVLHDKPQALLTLPGGLCVERSYDRLLFRCGSGDDADAPYAFEVAGPGTYPLPGGGELVVTLEEQPFSVAAGQPLQAGFDLDKAPFPWLVRTFRPGDRFNPSGMNGSKKVKELFIDRKIPLTSRRRIPLLFSGSTLLWVGGVRMSGAAAVDAATASGVRVEIRGFAPLRA